MKKPFIASCSAITLMAFAGVSTALADHVDELQSKIDTLQSEKAVNHQTSSHQQNERNGNFRDYQGTSAKSSRSPQGSPAFL